MGDGSADKKIPACHLPTDIKNIEDMKIKKGFVLRTLGNEQIVAGEGLEQINFSKLISLNATAAYLWRQVEDKAFDAATLAALLREKYGIDGSTATADSQELIKSWHDAGLIED